MGHAQQIAPDHFAVLFGNSRGVRRAPSRWPPEDGEEIVVTLINTELDERSWRKAHLQDGQWQLSPEDPTKTTDMVGRLWCEAEGLEGEVSFKVQVYPPANGELHKLIRAVTGTASTIPGRRWLRERSIEEEARLLAERMSKARLLVRVRVDKSGNASVMSWEGRA